MSKLSSTALIILGLIWIFYAVVVKKANHTAALSHAMALEAELKSWTMNNAPPEKVAEIFDEKGRLEFGGESKTMNFQEVISSISNRNAVPIWPGMFGIAIGIFALVAGKSPSKG